MHPDHFQNKKLLLGAQEAGSGSLLAALCLGWKPAPGTVALISDISRPYFQGIENIQIIPVDREVTQGQVDAIIRETDPEFIITGASAGICVEKRLMKSVHKVTCKVVSFVDHYWNLWQRFANTETTAKWEYQPDLIFVSAEVCKQKMLSLGCPVSEIGIYHHPLLHDVFPAPLHSVNETYSLLDLPADCVPVVFVSEYVFPGSEVWHWDQPEASDIDNTLISMLDAVASLNEAGCKMVLIIKKHPAQTQSFASILAKYPPALYREVGKFDKISLFQVSKMMVGLNSMFLLEAAENGVDAYSYCGQMPAHSVLLREINSKIKPIYSLRSIVEIMNSYCIAQL
jgi:hypothetical protein